MLQLALGVGHDLGQGRLSLGLHLRGDNESHPAPRHAAEHPESPEPAAEPLAHPIDQGFGVDVGGPGDDGLDGAEEIARRGG